MRSDLDWRQAFLKGTANLVAILVLMLALSSCASSDGVLKGLGGKQTDPRDQVVVANMQTLRLAVNAYGYKHDSKYPLRVDEEVKKFLPNVNGSGGALYNPFTKSYDWPVAGAVENVEKERASSPAALQAGIIEYSAIDGGKSFAIRGGGGDGKAIPGEAGPKSTLVLSSDR